MKIENEKLADIKRLSSQLKRKQQAQETSAIRVGIKKN